MRIKTFYDFCPDDIRINDWSAAFIRDLRGERGQVEFGLKYNCKDGTGVSKWEKGHRLPPSKIQYKMLCDSMKTKWGSIYSIKNAPTADFFDRLWDDFLALKYDDVLFWSSIIIDGGPKAFPDIHPDVWIRIRLLMGAVNIILKQYMINIFVNL